MLDRACRSHCQCQCRGRRGRGPLSSPLTALALIVGLAAGLGLPGPGWGAPQAGGPSPGSPSVGGGPSEQGTATEPSVAALSGPKRLGDPYEAYEAGHFDEALQSFVDRQVERPDDPALLLNIGSAHYRMRSYEEAERAFSAAALAAEPQLRDSALYNLGNVAYRQGKLQEAVDLYKAALEVNPDDQDAKYNLELVRDEIRRRHEEAKKRQEQQDQNGQQNQDGQQGGQGSQDQQDQQGQQDQQDQQGQQGQQDQQGQQGQQEQQDQQGSEKEQGSPSPSQGQEPQSRSAGDDQDGDGLADTAEQTADNPTDPKNPDSDGDGLKDGDEDANQNGRVDAGETDPNNPDSDGDGVPDGEEQRAGSAAAGGRASEDEEGLTPEEALRYLQALEEGRPQMKAPPGSARRTRPEKDW